MEMSGLRVRAQDATTPLAMTVPGHSVNEEVKQPSLIHPLHQWGGDLS